MRIKSGLECPDLILATFRRDSDRYMQNAHKAVCTSNVNPKFSVPKAGLHAPSQAVPASYMLDQRAAISSPAAVRSPSRRLFALGAKEIVPVGTSTT